MIAHGMSCLHIKDFTVCQAPITHLEDKHFKVLPLEELMFIGLQFFYLSRLLLQVRAHDLHIDIHLPHLVQKLVDRPAVPTWLLASLASSVWMLLMFFSMVSPAWPPDLLWVCWLWSTTPMILSRRARTTRLYLGLRLLGLNTCASINVPAPTPGPALLTVHHRRRPLVLIWTPGGGGQVWWQQAPRRPPHHHHHQRFRRHDSTLQFEAVSAMARFK